jgi:hypothetical protein
MSDMVRKQIYINRRQEALLKRLARLRGVSEAEIIRQAIDREANAASTPMPRDSRAALEEILNFALSRRNLPSIGKPYHWNRQEIYDERENSRLSHNKDE